MRGRLERAVWASDPGAHVPARYRSACVYEAFIPDLIATANPTIDSHLAGLIADAEHAILSLNASGGQALAPLARLLLRTESIASSKVEGLHASARDIAAAEAQTRKLTPTLGEIVASIDAMQLAIEDATDGPVTAAGIARIHAALMARTHPSIAGAVRQEQNWIGGNDYNPGGADFVPPPPTELRALMADLIAACNSDAHSPLLQAAVVHAQFETIHPFPDGNGRTGRALIHGLLRRRSLSTNFVPPISVILARRREQYIAGLEAFRAGDLERWLEVFAVAAIEAATLASGFVSSVRSLQGDWRDAVGPVRKDAVVLTLIELLPAHPVITVSIGVAATGRSLPQVRLGLESLQAAGALTPVGHSGRARSWEATRLLDLLSAVQGD